MHCASSTIIPSTHCLEVAHFTISPTHLPIGWKLFRWVAGITDLYFLLGCWSVLWFFCCILFYLWPYFPRPYSIKIFFSFKQSSIAILDLWAFTLLDDANICAYVTELVSTIEISSLFISTSCQHYSKC